MSDLNNAILRSYCSFELSKLLKEKGFDVLCSNRFAYALESHADPETGLNSGVFGWEKGELTSVSIPSKNSSDQKLCNKYWYLCSRPEHSVVVEWLRVNFDVYCYAHPITITEAGKEKRMYKNNAVSKNNVHYYNLNGKEKCRYFDTPEQAMEGALLYVLQNLI